jgi:3-isopropylmalate dehydrogenase
VPKRSFTIAVLPGDGIGPEVIEAGLVVLEAVAARFGFRCVYQRALVGGAGIDAHGDALTDEVLRQARRADAVLFGAVGGPRWDEGQLDPGKAIKGLRQGLRLFANLRPVRAHPALVDASSLRPEYVRNVDLLVVRELTGGLYFGKPRRRFRSARGGEGAIDTMRYTVLEIERIARRGFEFARQRRRHLTSVDKANVLENSRLWRETVRRLAPEYPDVTVEHLLVDACAMLLMRDPRRFDVIVTENLFGDILTDEAAMITGSLGMLPSASLGTRHGGLYEPIHGTAPDIAGNDVANPLATILSVALMLRYALGQPEAAQAVEQAVDRVLFDGKRTADIVTPGAEVLGTQAMGQAVVQALA